MLSSEDRRYDSPCNLLGIIITMVRLAIILGLELSARYAVQEVAS